MTLLVASMIGTGPKINLAKLNLNEKGDHVEREIGM
jgi:hypothetical protein